MHIPDGLLSVPVSAVGYAVSAAVVGTAVYQAKKTADEKTIPLYGITAAFVFAAQMINFPIGAGTSGHFLGAFLCATLLGPLNAILVMALVLIVQCLLFADGGITALGVNILNMGVAGSFVSWFLFSLLRLVLPKTREGYLLSAGIGAWFATVLVASAAALELSISGVAPLSAALPLMAGSHAIIGIGEALITVAVLTTLVTARPDLIKTWRPLEPMQETA